MAKHRLPCEEDRRPRRLRQPAEQSNGGLEPRARMNRTVTRFLAPRPRRPTPPLVGPYSTVALSGSGSSPIPVFVLGLQRSGTTWLANVLANHPNAVAVQAEDHFGIHESIFFSHFARAYGDLDDDLNFRRFAAEFTTSDYYMLTGLPPDWLLSDRPGSYPEAFRNVMDEMARRRGGVQLWIEKSPTHTLLAEELAAAFPDARFVGIERRPEPVIASQLRLDGDEPLRYPRRLLRLLSMCLTYSLNQRWLARFCRDCDRCRSTSYEALFANPARETERICAFLGVRFTDSMLDLPWRRNTSFEGRHRARDPSTLLTARWSPWPSPPYGWCRSRFCAPSMTGARRATGSSGRTGAGAAGMPASPRRLRRFRILPADPSFGHATPRSNLEPLLRHPVRNAWFATRIPISRSRLLARTLSLRAVGDARPPHPSDGGLHRRIPALGQHAGDLRRVAEQSGVPDSPSSARRRRRRQSGRTRHSDGRADQGAEQCDRLADHVPGHGHACPFGSRVVHRVLSRLVPLRDGFAVCPFDELVADPGLPISLLNDRFGLDLLNLRLDDEAKKELRDAIAHTQRLRGDPERKWSVPVSSGRWRELGWSTGSQATLVFRSRRVSIERSSTGARPLINSSRGDHLASDRP